MASKFDDRTLRNAPKKGALALLAAAEALYGRHGLDGVTIRQITMAAQMANNSAVTYHFGNKEGLLRAICEWRIPVLEVSAAAELDRARQANLLNDPATLIGVLLRPFLQICDEKGRHPHALFMQQMLSSPEGRAIRISLFTVSKPSAQAFDYLLASLPHVPNDLVRYRMRIGSVAFFDGLNEWSMGRGDSDFPQFTLESLVDELIGMIAISCMRPAA